MVATGTVIFEDPPEYSYTKSENRADHKEVAAALRKNPNTWGIVSTRYRNTNSSSAVADQIRKGLMPAYRPAGAYTAVSRTVRGREGKKEYRVYAKYVGKETAE